MENWDSTFIDHPAVANESKKNIINNNLPVSQITDHRLIPTLKSCILLINFQRNDRTSNRIIKFL